MNSQWHRYCIQLDQTTLCEAFLTSLTHNWPLMTFYDLIWPQVIFNFNPWQKFWVEIYVYLIYFDKTTRFDPYLMGLTQVWPLMTLIDLENDKSEFLRKFLFQPNVYWIHFDHSARFDPNSMIWPKFDLWWPLKGHDILRFKWSKKIRSFKAYVIKLGSLSGALEPFSGFCSVCSRAPPRHCRN